MTATLQPKPESVTLAYLLSNSCVPVQDAMFSALNIQGEARLSQVSTEILDHVKGYHPRNWDNILGKLFKDAKAFRSLQAQWNGIVAGPVLVDFFARTGVFIKKEPIMFLIIPWDCMDAAEAFLKAEGYSIIHSEWEERLRSFYFDNAELFIEGTSMNITIYNNFATWDKVSSRFPYPTFVQKEGYFTQLTCLNAIVYDGWDELRALSTAGYKIKDISWYGLDNSAGEDNHAITGRRRFGDRKTWIVKLPTDGITKSSIPNGAVESTVFAVEQRDDDNRPTSTYYQKQSNELLIVSQILRHQYSLLAHPNSTYAEKIEFLHRRLDNTMVVKISKTPEKERPEEAEDIFRNPPYSRDMEMFVNDFQKPSYWMYCDDDVIKYLNKLEEELVAGKLSTAPREQHKRSWSPTSYV